MIEVSRYIFITDEITVRHNGAETTQSYDAQLNTFLIDSDNGGPLKERVNSLSIKVSFGL